MQQIKDEASSIASPKENTQRVISAGIIVFRRTPEGIKFLILYHGRDYWNFPKGKVDKEERSWQAAFREAQEETGLKQSDLKQIRNFKTYEKFHYRRGKQKIFKVVILYLAETKKTQITVSPREHEGYGWFRLADARRIMSKHPDSLKILKQAHDFLTRQNRPKKPVPAKPAES